MQALIDRLRDEATYLGRGIIKADGIINHQLDPALTMAMGEAFAQRFRAAGVTGVTRVITAEVSGIAPALATAQVFGVPVVYARKHKPITMADGVYLAEAPSRTKGGIVQLMVSPEYLAESDRIILIDDFLATSFTIQGLVKIVAQSGATLCGIGCVVEKSFEQGRERLAHLGVPIVTLARADLDDDQLTFS